MKLIWLLACPLALSAHMVSMSTGELKVEGDRAHFELRIPTYEVAHVSKPEHTLLDHIRFKSGGAWGTPSAQTCKDEQGTYICTADYQFPAPGGQSGCGMHACFRDSSEPRAYAAGVLGG